MSSRTISIAGITRPVNAVLAAMLLMVAWLAMVTPTLASELTDAETQLARLDKSLTEITVKLDEDKKLTDAQLVELLNQTREIRSGQLALSDKLTESQDQFTQALEGAKPAEGTTVDAKAKGELEKLQSQQVKLQGLMVRLNLSIANSDKTLQAISDRRKEVYFSTITARSASPLSFKMLRTVRDLVAQDAKALAKWVKAQAEKLAGWKLGLRALALASFLLLLPGIFGNWLLAVETRLFPGDWVNGKPEWMAHEFIWLVSAGQVAFRLAVFVGLAVLVYALVRITGLVGGDGSPVIPVAFSALAGLAWVDAVSIALFSPGKAEWRLVQMTDAQAKRARIFALAAFSIFAISSILDAVYAHSHMLVPLESLQAQSGILSFLAALLVLLSLIEMPLFARWTKRLTGDTAEPPKRPLGQHVWRVVARAVLMLLITSGVIALLSGYIQLGRTLIWVVALGLVTIGSYLILRKGAFAANKLVSGLRRGHRADNDGAEEEGGAVLNIWLVLLLDMALLVGAAWAFLELGNIRLSDMELWLSRIAEGIPVGEIKIVPAKLAAGMLAFFATIIVFRLLQFYLRRIMTNDPAYAEGAGASIRALVGYFGVVVAVMVGFSSLGLSLSNITLIVSALSVGIGLGLQGIVNNMISGIILLFERSLKAGDWVVTSSDQGTIKKIGLRATEMETFDHATIFIPNSDLVTQPLKNWTHGSRSGRVRIAVGVAYDSDPETVRDILLKVAHNHKLALKRPEPIVYWHAFGDSSLDFELRVYLRDITTILSAETEMRTDIFKELQKAGITIPFPQRDVHLIRETDPAPKKPAPRRKRKPKATGPADGGDGADG